MNATLNIGQTIGDFRVEEFVKATDENGGDCCGLARNNTTNHMKEKLMK